ncbi:MAG: HNH endonuclease [Rhodobiaceae bacterium]|nr:HNH endonuclease [Rhodobiaceae bacterium]MCC0055892.1 HNH endonuclease [Rhodobiaceae bacterium]
MKSPHLDPVWLRQKYEVEGLSTYEIGAIVGRDPKRVYAKLRDFGIPTRPRGANLAGKDNYMRRPGVRNPFAGKSHSAKTKAVLSAKASVEKPYLRGAANGMSGRVGAANPNYRDGSAPERQRLYASSRWKDIQRAVYARDKYRCVACGAGKSGPRSLHAHHIRPWAGNESLRFDLSNLLTLCRPCHHWVHSKANVDGLYLHHSTPALASSART